MSAIDGMAGATPGCDNRGKPGFNIVGHGSFATKSGRRRRCRCTVCKGTLSTNSGTAYRGIRGVGARFEDRPGTPLPGARTVGEACPSPFVTSPGRPGTGCGEGACSLHVTDTRPITRIHRCGENEPGGTAAVRAASAIRLCRLLDAPRATISQRINYRWGFKSCRSRPRATTSRRVDPRLRSRRS